MKSLEQEEAELEKLRDLYNVLGDGAFIDDGCNTDVLRRRGLSTSRQFNQPARLGVIHESGS